MRHPEVTLSTHENLQPDPAKRSFAKLIAQQLAVLVGQDCFDLWFNHSRCFEYAANLSAEEIGQVESPERTIVVATENSFSQQRIQNNFGSQIREVVDRVCGPQFFVQYLVLEERQNSSAISTPKPSALTVEPQSAVIKFGPQAIPQPKRRTIKSFAFGQDNRLLQASVDQILQQPGKLSPFYVYGPTGSGKTHLLESLTNEFRRLKFKRCIFLSAEEFTSQFVASLKGGTGLPMFRRKYRDLDLLAIDDVQFLAGKRATLGEFQHTIDDLLRHGKQVIVASERPPLELTHLGADICNRLSAGLSCPVNYPDLEGRLKIAKDICRERSLGLSNSVLELICENLTRDVRRISGAINRLYAYSLALETRMTPEIATKVLGDLFAQAGPACSSLFSVEQAVCDICGIKPSELRSPSRKKKVSSARMLAMYLSRQYTTSAYSEIGDYYGGRSHSTVIAAQKKVAGLLADDGKIALPHALCSTKEVISRIESNLRVS